MSRITVKAVDQDGNVASDSLDYTVASGGSGAYVPYTDDSFFKSEVTSAPVDADRTNAFRTFMKSYPDQSKVSWPKITGTSGNQWGTTFSLSSGNDPIWKLSSSSNSRTDILKTQGVHIPDEVLRRIPTGAQDREMLIIDQEFRYSMWVADTVPNYSTRTLTVSSAAIFWHDSNGLDYRNPKSDSTKNFTSRGRIPEAGVIRPDLVAQAIANGTGLGHVLQFWLAETDANTSVPSSVGGTGFCHPMVGCEKRHVGGFGAEGERVRIKPSIDLASRGLTGAALVVARTLQENGAYIGDNSGSSTQLKGPQTTSDYNPWQGTNLSVDCLKGGITWDDFEVVPFGWQ